MRVSRMCVFSQAVSLKGCVPRHSISATTDRQSNVSGLVQQHISKAWG